MKILPAEREQRMGDRRDSVRRGRRKSDRINERLLKQSIRVDAGKIDDLMNQVGELVVSRAWFSQLFHEMRDLQQNLQHRARLESREMKQVKGLTFRLSEATVALGRVANELQEGVMKVRMLPIAQLFNRYPRLVFDLVRDGRKKVHLDIKGEETELDKMVIEAISDPLIHIIRNAVDHGIETAAERKKRGKPESGTICLEAYHEGNHVVIEITDDGQGLGHRSHQSQSHRRGIRIGGRARTHVPQGADRFDHAARIFDGSGNHPYVRSRRGHGRRQEEYRKTERNDRDRQ